MRRGFVGGLFLMVAAADAAGQSAAEISAGERVRIKPWNQDRTVYVVQAADSAGLTLLDPRRGTVRVLSYEAIQSLERSAGPRSRGEAFARKGGFGFLGGAIVGGTFGFATGDDDCSQAFICITRPEAAALMGGLLGVTGGVIGGIAGLASPGEKWAAARAPIRLSVAPAPAGGARVGAALAF